MCCSRYIVFFKQRIPFWNKAVVGNDEGGGSGGVGCDNNGDGGDGERVTFMATATTATAVMTAEAVMTTAVMTSAAATMTAVMLGSSGGGNG